MPIIVFGISSSSYDNGNKIDTSLFVQKPFLRTSYIESNIEEDIDLKNQYRNKNLPDPISIGEPVSKNYVDKSFTDPSILKNNQHIDLNDRNITNARFIQVNELPQIDSHLTAKLYVDIAIFDGVNELSLLGLHPDEKLNLGEQDSIFLNSSLTLPNTLIELPTESYVNSSHETSRNRRDLSSVFNDQDNEFDNNKLINLDSVTVYRNPNQDNELSNKKYNDDSIGEGTLVRFNPTLQNYLKVSVGNDIYKLTKFDKIQLTDTTTMKAGNTGGYVLPYWKNVCNDNNNNGKITNFIKSTKTKSPNGDSGATSLPPIGTAFMYIETSSGIHGKFFFVVSNELILFK